MTRRGAQVGAASHRLLLAFAASALLTAAVSLPLAYQAHVAREPKGAEARPIATPVQVLGTTTVKEPEGRTDTLYWQAGDDAPQLLHLATVSTVSRVVLRAPGAVQADFHLDDGPVETDTTEPFELFDGAPVVLRAGAHSLTVAVTDEQGRTQTHAAFFAVVD